MAELLFHGAAGEVTGSMHMLKVRGKWVALDCGLFHGRRAETEEKNRSWPVEPTEIAALILSHAHIDHSGRLPRLCKDGYEGPIFGTSATRDLCALMLPDSAHIQEEDIVYLNKKRKRKGLKPVEPLYRYKDALATVRLFHTVPYDQWFPVIDGLRARFNEAGHMLGSAGIELEISEKGKPTRRVYFTGDVGRRNKPIIRDPSAFPFVDAVICESTYGNRLHETVDDAKQMLTDVVQSAVERGGKVIIPAFSVGRTQSIVYYLREQMLEGALPTIPIYVDSPLSVNATEIFRLHPECYDDEAIEMQQMTRDILGGSNLTYIRDVDESKALHRRRKPCVIISASGMCEFGRIRHHLKNNITSPKNTILLPGFQAAHTLGRRLAEGAERVNIFHEEYRVQAQVHQLDGFSGHADQRELIQLLKPLIKRNPHLDVYLVHGEPEQSTALAEELSKNTLGAVEVAQRDRSVKLR